MKFRNPKTGEVYDVTEETQCNASGFCAEILCKDCKIDPHAKEECWKWVNKHPHTAARMMGYEVIEHDGCVSESGPGDPGEPGEPGIIEDIGICRKCGGAMIENRNTGIWSCIKCGEEFTPENNEPVRPFSQAYTEHREQTGMRNQVNYIITNEELLRQTAEEAAELAQAALKVIRSVRGTTPISEKEALDNLAEEIGDVQNCIDILFKRFPWMKDKAADSAEKKLERKKQLKPDIVQKKN